MSFSSDMAKSDTVLKIGQRMGFTIFGEDTEYTSRLEDFDSEIMTVAMPFDSRRVPIIPQPGDRLMGKIVMKSCAYRFVSEYKGSGFQPIPIWKITKPEMVEKYQNREFVRVKVSRPIKVIPISQEGKVGDPVPTNTIDISGGGLCFVSLNPLKVSSFTVIEMANIPNVEFLSLKAKVVRCRAIDMGNTKIYHIGVKFLDMPKVDQNKLIKFVFELQRKHLAMGL